MTRLTILFILTIAFTASGQETNDRLVGVYKAKDNAFEKWSILTLQRDKRFKYEFGVGGCQGEITGTWDTKENKLLMTTDKEFLDDENIFYPDMSLTTWSIRKKGIKPNGSVDSGCVKETRIHLRDE